MNDFEESSKKKKKNYEPNKPGQFIRNWVEIQGDLYDLFDLANVVKREEYNEVTNQMDYLVILNQNSPTKNIQDLTYKFQDKKTRDKIAHEIKQKLRASPGIIFVSEDPIGDVTEEFQDQFDAMEEELEELEIENEEDYANGAPEED